MQKRYRNGLYLLHLSILYLRYSPTLIKLINSLGQVIAQSRRKGITNSKQAADNAQTASTPTITLRASNEANLRYVQEESDINRPGIGNNGSTFMSRPFSHHNVMSN